MPKGKTGKVIKKIKINKKNIVLAFTNGEKLEISEEAYSSNYLYVGKELSKKDVDNLTLVTSVKKLSTYALNLLTKSHYTEWKMREKLYAKGGEKTAVDLIINRLKKVDLIDDKSFIEDYLGYAEEKGIGKNKIKQNLLNKGIFEEQINKIHFSYVDEKKKAASLVPSLEKKYTKYSYEQKKQHIYAALLARGFDNDAALFALSKISGKNDKDEKAKLKIDYAKTLEKYKRKYEGRDLYEKIVQRLRGKGYRYSDIKVLMEEKNYDF